MFNGRLTLVAGAFLLVLMRVCSNIYKNLLPHDVQAELTGTPGSACSLIEVLSR